MKDSAIHTPTKINMKNNYKLINTKNEKKFHEGSNIEHSKKKLFAAHILIRETSMQNKDKSYPFSLL